MENNIPKEIENKNKGSKRPYVIAVCLAAILVIMITSVSYAYFTATITNANNSTATSVTTGSLRLEFTDGAEVGLENATPGSYIEKTFSIKNTGNTDTVYDIYLSDLINDFEDKSDLVYTLSSSNGANVSETVMPDVSSKIVSNQQIGLNETHNYTLRIEFKETNDVQDDNANKQFSAVIRINEVKEAKQTITFNVNEGQELQINTKELSSGESYGKLPLPVRLNYEFDGWYTELNGGEKVESTDTFNLNSNQTLYAHWSAASDNNIYLVKNGELLFEPYFNGEPWDSNKITSSSSDGYWNVQVSDENYLGTIIVPKEFDLHIEGYIEDGYLCYRFGSHPLNMLYLDSNNTYNQVINNDNEERLWLYFPYLAHIKNLWITLR